MERWKSFEDILSHQDPSSSALCFFQHGSKQTWTYGELLTKIHAYPLPKERCVGVFASTTPEVIVALFALASKRRIVLLNPDDSIETLKLQVQATHVGVLLGDDELSKEMNVNLEQSYECEDNDILFFTSGTTSKAKAVMLAEQSLCAAAYNGGSLLPLTTDDSLLCILPLSHVFGFVCSLLWPLSCGALVCLGRGIRSVFMDFGEYKPTAATLVPQMAAFLASKKMFNPELNLILIGAGNCEDGVLSLIQSMGIRLSFGYGLTETSSGIALSLGINPRAMTICPDYGVTIAEDGEILVRSDTTLMKGYYDDPKGTKEVLEGNLLHTGDLGKIEDGLLFLTGRKKEILVFDDGSKLFLPEYEGDLRKYLGAQADFAVLQDPRGSVVLYIHKPREVEFFVEGFNSHLPRSHQIARIIYAPVPLPRTKTGKVQRYLIPLD